MYEYDAQGKVKSFKWWNSTETDEFTYNDDGSLLSVISPRSTVLYDYRNNTITSDYLSYGPKISKYTILLQGLYGPEFDGDLQLKLRPKVTGIGIIEGEFAKGVETGECEQSESVFKCTSIKADDEQRENTYQIVQIKQGPKTYQEYLTLKSTYNDGYIEKSYNAVGMITEARYPDGGQNTYTYDETGVNLLTSNVGGYVTTCVY